MTTLKILPLGDSALVCEAGTTPTLATQRRVWHVAALARDWPDVREVVPGMNNLTLLFDPLATDIDERCGELGACDVPAVVDVAELMLLGMLPSDCPVRAHLSVRGQPQLIELELTLTPVDGQPVGDPACARTSLDDLAAALGSIVRADFREQRWWAWMPLRGWAG